jgi:hypothetical protein
LNAKTITVLIALALAVGGIASAGDGSSGSAKVCQKGGWASPGLHDGAGDPVTFTSMGECVSFAARNGGVFKPSIVGEPNPVVEDEESFFIASGFHPLSQGTLTIDLIGGGTSTLLAMTTATGGLAPGVGTVFTSGACGLGITGADVTLVDGEGVHASTTIVLSCP